MCIRDRLWIWLNRNISQYPSKQGFSFVGIFFDESISLMLIAKLFQILDGELLAINDGGVAFELLRLGVSERYPPSIVCPGAAEPLTAWIYNSQNPIFC